VSNCHLVAGGSLIDLVASKLALRAPALRAAMLSRSLGVSRATCRRKLATLIEWEFIKREGQDLPHRGLDGRGRSASNAQQDHGNPKPRDHRNGRGQIGHKRGALELTSCGLWPY
jgi:DNA-binding Lrp family transcriptional regulator